MWDSGWVHLCIMLLPGPDKNSEKFRVRCTYTVQYILHLDSMMILKGDYEKKKINILFIMLKGLSSEN